MIEHSPHMIRRLQNQPGRSSNIVVLLLVLKLVSVYYLAIVKRASGNNFAGVVELRLHSVHFVAAEVLGTLHDAVFVPHP